LPDFEIDFKIKLTELEECVDKRQEMKPATGAGFANTRSFAQTGVHRKVEVDHRQQSCVEIS